MSLRPIHQVADDAGFDPRHVLPYGHDRAKISLDALSTTGPRGRYVLVTAITPTPAGEGKTVTSLGLSMGLWRQGHSSIVALRQSSLGPTFGRKGAGAGGGHARVEPFEAAVLGLGADLFAVESANNLLAAMVDNALLQGDLDLPTDGITWRRVVDVNDRSLRRVVTSAGGGTLGTERLTGFDITAASEVMGILALARDLADLRTRLGRIVVGFTAEDEPVTAEDIGAAGAMAALLRDAVRPNLLQTSDGTPALIHAGPFANLSAGVSSVIADRVALPHTEVLVTEAGFGADLGAEKLLHIKTLASGEVPDAVVLVATVRALRWHGGADDLDAPDVAAVEAGAGNLDHHVATLQQFGVPVVVAINRFPDDTPDELAVVERVAAARGCVAVAHTAFADGGAGAGELADAVWEACHQPAAFHRLYEPGIPVVEAVDVLARQVYGADGVDWSVTAKEGLARLEHAGLDRLPVCVAKTHMSLSHDGSRRGVPTGWVLPITEVRVAAGGGYVTVLTGPVLTMPGLPADPRARQIDLDANGTIVGLV